MEEVADRAMGTSKGDLFNQRNGSFIIHGFGGSDTFDTGSFNDLFIGGSGQDTFFIKSATGADRVRDFNHSNRNHDFVDVSALHLKESFSAFLHEHVTEKNGSAVISFTDGITTDSLTLHHTAENQLKVDFFIF